MLTKDEFATKSKFENKNKIKIENKMKKKKINELISAKYKKIRNNIAVNKKYNLINRSTKYCLVVCLFIAFISLLISTIMCAVISTFYQFGISFLIALITSFVGSLTKYGDFKESAKVAIISFLSSAIQIFTNNVIFNLKSAIEYKSLEFYTLLLSFIAIAISILIVIIVNNVKTSEQQDEDSYKNSQLGALSVKNSRLYVEVAELDKDNPILKEEEIELAELEKTEKAFAQGVAIDKEEIKEKVAAKEEN
jgi:hypothetical protein